MSSITEAPSAPSTRRQAVIDLGSNTSRLVLFRVSASGSLHAIEERKENPRLGHGVAPDGSLSREAIERGLAALTRFARTCADLGNPPVAAVATCAVRDAPNGPAFVQRVTRETGIPLRILTGVEEARYGYLGVASAFELHDDLVFDLGGGSLQLVAVRAGQYQNSVSMPLGSLRLTETYLEHDPPKGKELSALREKVREDLEAAFKALGGAWERVFGVGGTVRSLAKVAINLREYPISRVHGYPLRTHDLDALGEFLLDLPSEKRAAVAGIGGDRADVVLAGLVVLEQLLATTGREEIAVSGTGIREGIASETVGAELPAMAEELARRSVRGAAEALDFSIEHGESVERIAGRLFDLLSERRGWGTEERRALAVAAWMHDSGTAIDLWRHGRHSAYLIRNYPLWGIDQRETLLASMAAYVHEGDEPPSSWHKELLPVIRSSDIATARKLGTLLLVAETLDGGEPRFSLPGGSRTLSVALGKTAGATVSPKEIEGIRKPLSREFDLEVNLHDS